MPTFPTTMIELSSKTCHSAYDGGIDGRSVLYRSENDTDGAETSPLCHFTAGSRHCRRRCPHLCPVAKVVPFGEIEVYSGDLKHVLELMRCSGGLGMVILAGTHRGVVF